jgi:hypothetical protein
VFVTAATTLVSGCTVYFLYILAPSSSKFPKTSEARLFWWENKGEFKQKLIYRYWTWPAATEEACVLLVIRNSTSSTRSCPSVSCHADLQTPWRLHFLTGDWFVPEVINTGNGYLPPGRPPTSPESFGLALNSQVNHSIICISHFPEVWYPVLINTTCNLVL